MQVQFEQQMEVGEALHEQGQRIQVSGGIGNQHERAGDAG